MVWSPLAAGVCGRPDQFRRERKERWGWPSMEWKRVITPPAPMMFVSIVCQFVKSVDASVR